MLSADSPPITAFATRGLSDLLSQGILLWDLAGAGCVCRLGLEHEKSPQIARMPVSGWMNLCFIVLEKQHLDRPASSTNAEKPAFFVEIFFMVGKFARDEAF